MQWQIERAVDANVQWQIDTREHVGIQGLGGLAAIPPTHVSTDPSLGPPSGSGIVGEFMRHGRFDNCLSAVSQVKRNCHAQVPVTSAQVGLDEPTTVKIDTWVFSQTWREITLSERGSGEARRMLCGRLEESKQSGCRFSKLAGYRPTGTQYFRQAAPGGVVAPRRSNISCAVHRQAWAQRLFRGDHPEGKSRTCFRI